MLKEHSHNKLNILKNFVESFGIDINIGKNKARGNKGIFIRKNTDFRIDISKNTENPIGTIIHEFAHYIHSIYDKNLKSLDFVFGNLDNEINEELIKITVENVPKDFATDLFNKKSEVEKEIKSLAKFIKTVIPDFKLSEPNKQIEKSIGLPAKYLLKYDRVRIFTKIISVGNIEQDCPNLTPVQAAYIQIKSKKRLIGRINSKISRLNRYYNQPTELFARFVESYFTDNVHTQQLAPKTCKLMENVLNNQSIKELSELNEIMQ